MRVTGVAFCIFLFICFVASSIHIWRAEATKQEKEFEPTAIVAHMKAEIFDVLVQINKLEQEKKRLEIRKQKLLRALAEEQKKLEEKK